MALHCNLHFIDSKYSCNQMKMMLNLTSVSPSFSSREGGGGKPQNDFGSDHGFSGEVGYLWGCLMLPLLLGRYTCPKM